MMLVMAAPGPQSMGCYNIIFIIVLYCDRHPWWY